MLSDDFTAIKMRGMFAQPCGLWLAPCSRTARCKWRAGAFPAAIHGWLERRA